MVNSVSGRKISKRICQGFQVELVPVIGCGLFSDSPLTTPKPTLPPSPTQKLTSLDDHNPSPFSPHFPPDPQLVPGQAASSSTSAHRLGEVENTGKRYGSNKRRSHAK